VFGKKECLRDIYEVVYFVQNQKQTQTKEEQKKVEREGKQKGEHFIFSHLFVISVG
jgi:hypothetical protein